MNVCYIYDDIDIYTKNKIIKRALKLNDFNLIECKSSLKNGFLRNVSKYFQFLFKKHRADVILVGFVGQPIVKPVKFLTNKPVIFDAFMSMYNTLVEDKQIVKKNSSKAKLLHFLDKQACNAADLILLDTEEHINYFINEFQIPKHKFKRLYIGAHDEIFFPKKSKENKTFTVEFHGGFIPLQGIQTIIEAARILKNEKIKFIMAGSGQTFNQMKSLAKDLQNMEFIGHINPNEIPDFINDADIGLGIFGTTPKALRVIPNKAFEVLAMGKPLITEDSIATRELLVHETDCLLTKPGDPKELADAILNLKNNKELRTKISKKGLTKFKSNSSTKILGEEIKQHFNYLK